MCAREKCYLESAILTVTAKVIQVVNSVSQGVFFFLFVCYIENQWQICTGKPGNKPEYFLYSCFFGMYLKMLVVNEEMTL